MEGRRVKGRQVLHLLLDHYTTSRADKEIKEWQDLLQCRLYRNKTTLETFVTNWERVLLDQSERPADHILEGTFIEQLDKCDALKTQLEVYRRLPRGHPERGYDKLMEMCKVQIDVDKQARNRAALRGEGQHHVEKGLAAVPVGVCRAWMKQGDCPNKKSCPWAHTHVPESKGIAKSPPRAKSPKKGGWETSSGKGKGKNNGKNGDKNKGKGKNRSKSPGGRKEVCNNYKLGRCSNPCPDGRWHPPICNNWKNNNCQHGDRCIFMHTNKALPAPEYIPQEAQTASRGRSRSKSKKRKSSPAPASMTTAAKATVARAVDLHARNGTSSTVSDVVCRLCDESGGMKIPHALVSSCKKVVKSGLKVRKVTFGVKFANDINDIIDKHNAKPTIGYEEVPTEPRVAKSRYSAKTLRKSLVKARYKARLLRLAVRDRDVPCATTTLEGGYESTSAPSHAFTVKQWIVDSGASWDLVSRHHLDANEIGTIEETDQVKHFETANGIINTGEKIRLSINHKGNALAADPYVLDDCPAVLSLGQRVQNGYEFHWIPGENPVLIAPNGNRIVSGRRRQRTSYIKCCSSTLSIRRRLRRMGGKPPRETTTRARCEHFIIIFI